MQPQFDAQGRPVPEAFQQAVAGFAEAMDFDAEQLIQGAALDFDELRFWMAHHGEDDPLGCTILADVGEPPAEKAQRLATIMAMLQYHGAFPVAQLGYYGYLPHLNRLVYCTRIALDEVEDGAEAIASTLAVLGEALRTQRHDLAAGMRAAASATGDTASANGQGAHHG